MAWFRGQAALPMLEADFLATMLHDLEISEEASCWLHKPVTVFACIFISQIIG
jgi:hypothetical protein